DGRADRVYQRTRPRQSFLFNRARCSSAASISVSAEVRAVAAATAFGPEENLSFIRSHKTRNRSMPASPSWGVKPRLPVVNDRKKLQASSRSRFRVSNDDFPTGLPSGDLIVTLPSRQFSRGGQS